MNVLPLTEREPLEIPHAYSSLLSSNSWPSVEVSVSIKTLIEEHELQLASIQEQVDNLKRRLTDMEHRQARTKDVLNKLHATLAPIKRLPPELLSEIFEYCLDTGSSRMPFSLGVRSREAPLLLGRVCHSWRAIAHATPRLWQNIFINVCDGRYASQIRKDAFPVLETWLAHSGGLPLNLVILSKTERVLPGLLDLFDIFAANAARWKTVRVRLQNAPAVYRLVSRAFSGCTSLSAFDVTDGGQCMSFFGNRQANEAQDAQPVRFDLSSPLNHLSLSLAGLTIRDVQLSWATLTHLSFMLDARSSTSSITDYVSVLRQCTSLKECCLAIDSSARDAPPQPFSLANLERLQLQVLREAVHTTQTGDLLGALDAPRLRALVIDDYSPRREVVRYHGALRAFLHTHAQTLRELRFTTSSRAFSAMDMMELVSETPLLTALEYHPDEQSSPKALLAALTPHAEGEEVVCLLPRLEGLFVYWDTSETVSMVGDLVEKRYALVEQGITRLRRLLCKPVRMSIVYDCMVPLPMVENLAARLEPFCRNGLLQVEWEAYRYDLEFLYC